MKRGVLIFLLLGSLSLTGCMSHYTVVLNNGRQMIAKGKPHLNKDTNRYVFKDLETGQQVEVSALLVREIGPEGEVNQDNKKFIPRSSK